MPYKYFGKTTSFRGKTLWEICGNLKNFGIGRIVVRSRFERYPEPSYLKILKVETDPEPPIPSLDDRRKIRVWVENTFRGKLTPEPVIIYETSYKADYRLIPKDEEVEYCKPVPEQSLNNQPKIMPHTTDFPPILKELIVRESRARGTPNDDPRLEIIYSKTALETKYRIAQEGETPSYEIPCGLGIPASPSLYSNIKV